MARNFIDNLAIAGAGAIVAGAALAESAWIHMRDLSQAYGVICGVEGGAVTHCAACPFSVALLAVGGLCVLPALTRPARAMRARAKVR